VLTGVEDEVDSIERRLSAKAVGKPIGHDHAHGCGGSSGGVRSSGHKTNGPATNRRMVATMIAIATPGG
jgi:hypothetical protein